MRKLMPCTLAATAILMIYALAQGIAKDDKEEMVDNPYYKGWMGFKPGSKVILQEKTVYGDGGTEERTLEYRLTAIDAERVTVRTAVIERELLSLIETAPTKIYYPVKVSKAEMTAALQDADAKPGKDVLKIDDKEHECTTFEIVRKSKSGEITSKSWRSAAVPGGIVRRVRTTSAEGKLVATTTTSLVSFVLGDGAKVKAK